MDALILAGGNEKPFSKARAADAAYAIDGRTMLDHVVDALATTGRFERIIVVGPEEALDPRLRPLVKEFIEPSPSLTRNLEAGLRAIGGDEPVLAAASDIPLLTAGAVEDFLARCGRTPDADLYYPVIPKEVFSAFAPGIRRTFLRLSDGVYTGGNMILLRPRTVLERMDLADRVLKLRKKPICWGRLLGWGFFLKAAVGGVSLAEIEDRVQKRFKIKGVAVRCESLEIGLDADSEEDLGWIRFYWGLERRQDSLKGTEDIEGLLRDLQNRLDRGEIKKASVHVELRPGRPCAVSAETDPPGRN